MITRQHTLQLLRDHGWAPTDDTASRDGEWVPGTSFDDEMGVHAEYLHVEVLAWLGY